MDIENQLREKTEIVDHLKKVEVCLREDNRRLESQKNIFFEICNVLLSKINEGKG